MMVNKDDLLQRIRAAAIKRYLFLPHALRQMNRPERMIGTREIRHVVDQGEIIENYPKDARGHSCLILGFGEANRPIHIVCAPKEDYLAIITAYVPGESEWSSDYKTRRTL